MNLDFSSLNENQRMAVEWDEGPLLVLAGPGSGKTKVLTMRVAKLILDSPRKRFRVLGLTFGNKAAAEMRLRVEEMVPDCRERALLTTFHSFCADILRQHGNHLGIKPDFTILNQEADREAVLRDAMAELASRGDDVRDDDAKLMPIIDHLLAGCVPESQVRSEVSDETHGLRLAQLYVEYKRQLVIYNRLDFPSLLILAHELLEIQPAIVKQLRIIYPHLCVDEFQDTNFAQYSVLKHLVGSNPKNLFVVADDDQIIYQWNGASPERLATLRKDFDMAVVQLPASYRCPGEVITLANRLIRNNLERAADKEPLYSTRSDARKDAVRLRNFASVDDELAWVARDIKAEHSNETGNCVVLGRTRKLLERAAQRLADVGLDAYLAVKKTEFVSAPFRCFHALLRLANGRGDREQLRRLCKSFYELEGLDLHVEDISAYAARENGDLLKAWFASVLRRQKLEENTRRFLERGYKKIVERLDVLGFSRDALEWLDEQERALADQGEDGFVDYVEELATWRELQKQFVDKYGPEELTLNVFLQELDLSEKSPPIPADAIRCLTIHAAKGLEFVHVYLIGLAEDQLPSFQSIRRGDQSREMQEERRNCFVAITRARETLTLTYAHEYFGWKKAPSRFLREMGFLNG